MKSDLCLLRPHLQIGSIGFGDHLLDTCSNAVLLLVGQTTGTIRAFSCVLLEDLRALAVLGLIR